MGTIIWLTSNINTCQIPRKKTPVFPLQTFNLNDWSLSSSVGLLMGVCHGPWHVDCGEAPCTEMPLNPPPHPVVYGMIPCTVLCGLSSAQPSCAHPWNHHCLIWLSWEVSTCPPNATRTKLADSAYSATIKVSNMWLTCKVSTRAATAAGYSTSSQREKYFLVPLESQAVWVINAQLCINTLTEVKKERWWLVLSFVRYPTISRQCG